jgi:hypothetical protein
VLAFSYSVLSARFARRKLIADTASVQLGYVAMSNGPVCFCGCHNP